MCEEEGSSLRIIWRVEIGDYEMVGVTPKFLVHLIE